ncbi:MAG: hypothetical protein ACOCUS_04235 [Polyangiales bacterium]
MSDVQSIEFDRGRDWNEAGARTWLNQHGYEPRELETAEDVIRAEIAPPWRFAPGSLREVALDPGQGITAWTGERRQPNPDGPSHALPARTVHLGYALELVIADGELRYHASWPRQSMALLAPDDAFEREAGYGRLFIIGEQIEGERGVRESRAAEAYRDWHKGRDPERVIELDGPDAFDERIGRAVSIVYASDKFSARGDFVDYEHDFAEPGPIVYYSGDPEGYALSGGCFEVDPRGIVD